MTNKEFFYTDEEPDPHPTRKGQERALSKASQVLFGELPEDVQPTQTATRFPHIMNRITMLWGNPKLAERYFDQLLIDDRGGRQGFPLSVLSELFSLKEYYLTKVYPKPASKWDEVFVSKNRG